MSTPTSNPPTDDRSAALPESLGGRYRIGRELGRGGMASVHLARDEKHGRDVATKVIRQKLDPASAVVLSHMSVDYRLAGQLDSALVESRRALETDSTNYTTLVFGVMAYLASNRVQEAHALLVSVPANAFGRG